MGSADVKELAAEAAERGAALLQAKGGGAGSDGSAASTAAEAACANPYREIAEAGIAARERGDKGPGCLVSIVQKMASYGSFSPMVLVAVIPDIRVAALVAACVAVLHFILSTLWFRLRIAKVYPKKFDLVNIAIYTSMTAASYTHPAFTKLWMPVFTAGLTGLYFLTSQLAGHPFCDELARESVDPAIWRNPAFKNLNWWISFWWTAALWTVALCALAAGLVEALSGPSPPVYLALDLVMGIAPLVAAIIIQHAMVRRFRGRITKEGKAILAERGAAAGGAAPAAPAAAHGEDAV